MSPPATQRHVQAMTPGELSTVCVGYVGCVCVCDEGGTLPPVGTLGCTFGRKCCYVSNSFWVFDMPPPPAGALRRPEKVKRRDHRASLGQESTLEQVLYGRSTSPSHKAKHGGLTSLHPASHNAAGKAVKETEIRPGSSSPALARMLGPCPTAPAPTRRV